MLDEQEVTYLKKLLNKDKARLIRKREKLIKSGALSEPYKNKELIQKIQVVSSILEKLWRSRNDYKEVVSNEETNNSDSR